MTPSNPSPRHFAVVPAGGVGSRLGAAVPKQYLPLCGRTVLEHAVAALTAADWIETVVVVVAPDDARAASLLRGMPRVVVSHRGGAERRDSVLGGLHSLQGRAREDDWVLVHDAARPGLTRASLERLRDALAGHPVGGLLGLPVADTVKRAGAGGDVECTVPREGLWLAQTPQMFRLGLLREALAAHPAVTDEAGAVEAMGLSPRVVEGDRRNFKVTAPQDLELMRILLAAQEAGRLGSVAK